MPSLTPRRLDTSATTGIDPAKYVAKELGFERQLYVPRVSAAPAAPTGAPDNPFARPRK